MNKQKKNLEEVVSRLQGALEPPALGGGANLGS